VARRVAGTVTSRSRRQEVASPPSNRIAASAHAYLACELGVVELDPAETVGAEQHPESQERDQRGDAGTGRAERDQDARRQDAADDQEKQALVHAPIFPATAPGRPPEPRRR
jgi:hypothetical protein